MLNRQPPTRPTAISNAPRQLSSQPPPHPTTVISNEVGRRFFFHVCSCKRVGLRSEKSLFSFFPPTKFPSSSPTPAAPQLIACSIDNLPPAPPPSRTHHANFLPSPHHIPPPSFRTK